MNADPVASAPRVIRTWLRHDEVTCARGREWAGTEGDTAYVIDGVGVVCAEHVTEAEKRRAEPQP